MDYQWRDILGVNMRPHYLDKNPDREIKEYLQEARAGLEEEQEYRREAAWLQATQSELIGRSTDRNTLLEALEKIQPSHLADPLFWEVYFSLPKPLSRYLFTSLPSEAQNNALIQQTFFREDPSFCVHVSKDVSQKLDPELVNKAWMMFSDDQTDPEVSLDRSIKITPWNLLSPQTKRAWIDYGLRSQHAQSLDAVRQEFKDVFPEDAWNDLMRTALRSAPDQISSWLLRANTEERERIKELFSQKELREIALSLYTVPIITLHDLGIDIVTLKARIETTIRNKNLNVLFKDFEHLPPDKREWIINVFAQHADVFGSPIDQLIRDTLALWMKKHPAATLFTLESILDLFSHMGEASTLDKQYAQDVADYVIKPVLVSQGDGAFRVFNALSIRIDDMERNDPQTLVIDWMIQDTKSAKIFGSIAKTVGAKMNDFLVFYNHIHFGDTPDDFKLSHRSITLSQEPELLVFLKSSLPWTREVYTEFKQRLTAGESETRVVSDLQAKTSKDLNVIRQGDYKERAMSTSILDLVSHVFPPAFGVSREEYARLIKRREDRQADVPEVWNRFQAKTASFGLGAWQLQEGQTFDIGAWRRIQGFIREAHETKQDAGHFGIDQITTCADRCFELLSQGDEMLAKEIFIDAYRLALSRGMSQLSAVVGREDAIQVTTWIGDGQRDMIDLMLHQYQQRHADRFQEKVVSIFYKPIKEKAKRALITTIVGILHRSSDRQIAQAKLVGVLKNFSLELDEKELQDILDVGRSASTENVSSLIDRSIKKPNVSHISNQKIANMVVQKVLGSDADAMRKELGKWVFIEGASDEERFTIEYHITKRRLHSVAGLNMGVCVAIDDALWQKETFTNVVLFDEDGIAQGGMHFEIIQDRGKTFLTLPGINPSMGLLRKIEARRLVESMIDYAKLCAKAIKATAVLIPTDPIICSNRDEVKAIITSLGHEKYTLSQQHQFSYKPFSYAWDEAYWVTT